MRRLAGKMRGVGGEVLLGSPSHRAAFLPWALALPASVYSPCHV